MKILLTNENILKLIYSHLSLSELQVIFNKINNLTSSRIILSLLNNSSIFRSMGRTQYKLVGHEGGVMCLAMINENLFISAAQGKTLKVWDITTYQCIKTLQDEQFIKTITILPDGNIATSSNAFIKIRNIKDDFNCIKIIKLQGYDHYSKLFVLSNDKLACLCFWDLEVWLLILDMNKEFDCIQKISEEGKCVANCFAHLGDKFAYGIDSQDIKIRNVLDYEYFKTLEGHTEWVNALIFIKKYNLLLSGSFDCTIRAWCTIGYQCIRKIELSTNVESLLLLPNGYFAAGLSSDEGVIKIWDITNYECINSFQTQSGMITSLLLTKDKRIISASPLGNTIIICDK
jgi:WD40 repeat protein